MVFEAARVLYLEVRAVARGIWRDLSPQMAAYATSPITLNTSTPFSCILSSFQSSPRLLFLLLSLPSPHCRQPIPARLSSPKIHHHSIRLLLWGLTDWKEHYYLPLSCPSTVENVAYLTVDAYRYCYRGSLEFGRHLVPNHMHDSSCHAASCGCQMRFTLVFVKGPRPVPALCPPTPLLPMPSVSIPHSLLMI